MRKCALLGHRYRFRAERRDLVWTCERGCGSTGRKTYATAEQARRYARAFDREDRNDLGRRAPVLGMFPLRLARLIRRRRRSPIA